MDSYPSKRRKLSPPAAAAVNVPDIPSSRKEDRTTPTRPSYTSPTKASLARFNPNLLPDNSSKNGSRRSNTTAGSSPGGGRRAQRQSRAIDRPRRGNGETMPSLADVSTTASAKLSTPTLSPGLVVRPVGGKTLAIPRRRSQTLSGISLPIASGHAIGPDVPASPPEAAPDLAHITHDELNLQTVQETQESAIERLDRIAKAKAAMQLMGEAEDPEPELPRTPTQHGLEAGRKQPKGLLYSSPSMRPRKKKKGSGVKSSPLKPRGSPPKDSEPNEAATSQPTPIVLVNNTQQSLEKIGDPAREKKDELAQLSMQLRELQDDMMRLEAAVSRNNEQVSTEPESQEVADNLISILTSTNPTHKPVPQPPKLPPLSQRLSLFLPFSKRPTPPAPDPDSTSLPLPSFHPLSLADPLPHLRVFTPLTITSSESIISPTNPDDPLLQRQDISLTSPLQLLTAQIQLTVNPTTQTIADLQITKLSPWAGPELGKWSRACAIEKDITAIGWAMGQYWEVAEIRARCWIRCEREFGDLLSISLPNTQSTAPGKEKTVLPKRKGRRRKEASVHNAETSDSVSGPEPEAHDEQDSETAVSRKELLVHLGRQSLILNRDGVSLLVTWSIAFDWTGEVESRLEATAAFLEAWKQADERKALDCVGEVFERLVAERGVWEAVRVVAELLFRG